MAPTKQQQRGAARTGGLRFSVAPGPGDSGFQQWLTAMQMVARLQGGIPPEFRRTLWLTLADKHLQHRGVDWLEAERLCFSEWSNPDDDELGVQIVKDLHRTGCSMFCGQSNQAVLKRVLLAYARWNKAVGYCQGFNMLAALILQVMDRNEPDSVKVMIYLIEGVLPESYFANNLRGLSVDMAVFRDLLRLRLPQLSRHLEHLQMEAGDNTGTCYEPPLTNVFTMQWFLTLFCNCLPQPTVLRVWDLIFLEGNQILLRTALAIWDHLADRILTVNSADEFYSIMGVLTREILEFSHVDSNRLIKTVVALQCPELPALRDKYMYNITPWTSTVSSGLRRGLRLFYTEDDSGDSGDNSDQDDDERIAVAAAFGIADLFRSPRRRGSVNAGGHAGGGPRGAGGPGAAGGGRPGPLSAPDRERERLSLDVSMLKQQYCRLRERQRQAHIIVTAACGGLASFGASAPLSAPAVAMNHLLIGKPALRSAKGRRLPPPPGTVPPPNPRAPAGIPALAAKRGGGQAKPARASPRPVETLHWKDEDKRRKSLQDSGVDSADPPPRPRRPRSRSGSTSSHHSNSSSSTSTELCDDTGQPSEDEMGAEVLQQIPKAAPEATHCEEPATADLLHLGDVDVKCVARDSSVQHYGQGEEDGDGDLMGWDTRPSSRASSKSEEKYSAPSFTGLPDGAATPQLAAGNQRVDEILELLDDGQKREAGEPPDRVVASVTEKLRLIMEHLEQGVPCTPPEGADTTRETSPTSTSSRESRQRLMERLFGREGSVLEESGDEATSLKSSALELDLGELLEESDDEEGERARSAAGDVEGVTASGQSKASRLDRQNSEKASKIIRENSEILQRISAWQRSGRSLTLPERSEPPDLSVMSCGAPRAAPTAPEPQDDRAHSTALPSLSECSSHDVGEVGVNFPGERSAYLIKRSSIEMENLNGTVAHRKIGDGANSSIEDLASEIVTGTQPSDEEATSDDAATRCFRSNSTALRSVVSSMSEGTTSSVVDVCSDVASPTSVDCTISATRDVVGEIGLFHNADFDVALADSFEFRSKGKVSRIVHTGKETVLASDFGTTTGDDTGSDEVTGKPPRGLPDAGDDVATTASSVISSSVKRYESSDSFEKTERPTRLSRTLSRDSAPADPVLSKQMSLDESHWRRRDRPGERLQLILDTVEGPVDLEGAEPASTRTSAKPKYKFPEMSPVNTSPLQPVPNSLLAATQTGQPKKWRPHLSPPSTPIVEKALTRPERTRPVLAAVALDTPTTLPVQTPSLSREVPQDPQDELPALQTSRCHPNASSSPPTSPLSRPPAGWRRKAGSPDGARSPVTFNPFPSRTNIRQPKEIGVKLGLYPSAPATSPTGSSSKRT